jgi:hypothetical protein
MTGKAGIDGSGRRPYSVRGQGGEAFGEDGGSTSR